MLTLRDISRIEDGISRGTAPTEADIRSLLDLARLVLTPMPAASKRAPPPKGMTPQERKALIAAIEARRLPGPWKDSPRSHGAGLHVGTGTQNIHRDAQGVVTYNIHRHSLDGTWILGTFVGPKWPDRLAEALLQKFLELNPRDCGWAVGQHARAPDGSEFTVAAIKNNRLSSGPTWQTPQEAVFIDLLADAEALNRGPYYSASDCTRLP